MNILLISPSYAPGRNAAYFPLGMASISACLKRRGDRVECLNFNNYHDHERLPLLEKILTEHLFDVVGVGGLSVTLPTLERIVKIVRTQSPKSLLLLGGGILTADPEVIFNTLKPDIGIVGEGEATILEVMERLEAGDTPRLDDVLGIIYRPAPEAEPIQTPERPAITDLDTLPAPDMEGFGLAGFLELQPVDVHDFHLTRFGLGKMIPYSASRSCPYKCTFCFHPTSQIYRRLTMDRIMGDLKGLLARHEASGFLIYDELFDYDKGRIKAFCNRLLDEGMTIRWFCQLRVNKVDLELLKLMKQSGCDFISFGFESASAAVLDSMRKRIKPSDLERAVHLAREAGIGFQANFLYGDPAENEETIAETLAFQDKNRLDFVDWSAVIAYPGTQLYHEALEKRIITDRIGYTRQIANGATFLWNTLQPPINMTGMEDALFRDWYLRLREITDRNNRRRPAGVADLRRLDRVTTEMRITCPSCGDEQQREMRYPPDAKAGGDFNPKAPYFGLRGVNMLCLTCLRKMHLPGWVYPAVAAMYGWFRAKVETLVESGEEVVLLGAMDRYWGTFSEQVPLSELNLVAALDSRPYRIGQSCFGLTVQAATPKAITEYCTAKEPRWMVIPPNHMPDGYLEMVQTAGISDDRMIAWSESGTDH
ncbi:MAG: B12-binding domain-containing radical SAM protein [Magnetococcales bacterium]|nr:B12-binding domain-containing radical SAM protein [Magnetococcales bacterium]